MLSVAASLLPAALSASAVESLAPLPLPVLQPRDLLGPERGRRAGSRRSTKRDYGTWLHAVLQPLSRVARAPAGRRDGPVAAYRRPGRKHRRWMDATDFLPLAGQLSSACCRCYLCGGWTVPRLNGLTLCRRRAGPANARPFDGAAGMRSRLARTHRPHRHDGAQRPARGCWTTRPAVVAKALKEKVASQARGHADWRPMPRCSCRCGDVPRRPSARPTWRWTTPARASLTCMEHEDVTDTALAVARPGCRN